MNKRKDESEGKSNEESGTEGESGPGYVAVYITGGVHAIPAVSAEPETVLTRWSLRQVIGLDGKRSRHLVGWAEFEGRVCSSIVSLDLAKLHVIVPTLPTQNQADVRKVDLRTWLRNEATESAADVQAHREQ